MKQGEILKEYAQVNKISVAQLGRDLKRERSQIYQLFKTEAFSEKIFEQVLSKYPDFSEFEAKFNFQNARRENVAKGHSAEDPPPLDAGQLAHMILSPHDF